MGNELMSLAARMGLITVVIGTIAWFGHMVEGALGLQGVQ